MKKILMLLALAGLTSAAWAQNSTSEVVEYEVIQVQDKYQVITNPFWSNWFFSIGGGAKLHLVTMIQPEVLANVLVRR